MTCLTNNSTNPTPQDPDHSLKKIRKNLLKVFDGVQLRELIIAHPIVIDVLYQDWKDIHLEGEFGEWEPKPNNAGIDTLSFGQLQARLLNPAIDNVDLSRLIALHLSTMMSECQSLSTLRYSILKEIYQSGYGRLDLKLTGLICVEMADACLDFSLKSKSDSAEIALGYIKEGRIVIDSERHPDVGKNLDLQYGRALLQKNGIACNRAVEDAISILKRCVRYFSETTCDDKKVMTASLYLGNAYLSRISGNRESNLKFALNHYTKALKRFSGRQNLCAWAKIHMNIGSIFSQIQSGEKRQNVEKSIRHFRKSLSVFDLNCEPQDWIASRMNIGNAFLTRIAGQRITNVERAITYFRISLKFSSTKTNTLDRGKILINLGMAYFERSRGDISKNLEQAKRHYEEASKVFDVNNSPYGWALTNMNLGLILWKRKKGDRGKNLENSIRCFQNALQFWRQESQPQEWARTQMNLGIVYSDRIIGNKENNLEMALEAHRNSLKVYSRNDTPILWAKARINLGNTYIIRLAGARAANIERAICHYRKALDIWSQAKTPYEWARGQYNLGYAYTVRRKGGSKSDIIRSMENFNAALMVWIKDAFPFEWARTHYQLGKSIILTNDNGNRSQLLGAINHLNEALSVINENSLPSDARGILNTLADVFVRLGEVPKALDVYHRAVRADQVVYQQNFLVHSKSSQIEKRASLYFDISWCLAKLGETEQSLVWLEKGKTIALTELMTRDLLNYRRIKHPQQNRYKKLTNRLKHLESEQRNPKRQYQDIMEDTQKVRSELDTLAAEIKNTLPDAFNSKFHSDDLKDVLTDQNTAVLIFNFSNHGTIVYLAFKTGQEISIESLFIDCLTTGKFTKKIDLWIRQYFRFSKTRKGSPSSWSRYITRFLNELSESFMEPIGCKLKEKNISKIILVPHRSAHILPLGLLTFKKGRRRVTLSDEFEISFAPDLSILKQRNFSEFNQVDPCFVGFSNSTLDLRWADEEVFRICKIFGKKSYQIYGMAGDISEFDKKSFQS